MIFKFQGLGHYSHSLLHVHTPLRGPTCGRWHTACLSSVTTYPRAARIRIQFFGDVSALFRSYIKQRVCSLSSEYTRAWLLCLQSTQWYALPIACFFYNLIVRKTHNKEIAKDYCSSWQFVVDLVAVIPIDMFCLLQSDHNDRWNLFAYLQLSRVIKAAHVRLLFVAKRICGAYTFFFENGSCKFCNNYRSIAYTMPG